MSCDDMRYLVDTNALSEIGRTRRTTKFFREHAALPTEVLHEAENSPDIQQLRRQEYATTPAVLRLLVRIMKTIPVNDSQLIDLYKNQGGADPLVVACALDAKEYNNQLLYSEEWVIVTGDKAVRALATKFDIPAISTKEFKGQIDAESS